MKMQFQKSIFIMIALVFFFTLIPLNLEVQAQEQEQEEILIYKNDFNNKNISDWKYNNPPEFIIDSQGGYQLKVNYGQSLTKTLKVTGEKVYKIQMDGRPYVNWTQKVGHIFKQLIRIELCIVQGAILLILF